MTRSDVTFHLYVLQNITVGAINLHDSALSLRQLMKGTVGDLSVPCLTLNINTADERGWENDHFIQGSHCFIQAHYY
jgi:hypothetical protein